MDERMDILEWLERDYEREEQKEIPGKLEWLDGKMREVKQPHRLGWWRFHEHYDWDGYCDNPARGY